jgi:hypothetical protein
VIWLALAGFALVLLGFYEVGQKLDRIIALLEVANRKKD